MALRDEQFAAGVVVSRELDRYERGSQRFSRRDGIRVGQAGEDSDRHECRAPAEQLDSVPGMFRPVSAQQMLCTPSANSAENRLKAVRGMSVAGDPQQGSGESSGRLWRRGAGQYRVVLE